MSDNKDKGAKEPPVEFDSESTIELDISKLGIVTSTSTDEHSSDNDSDETISDLMEINENLLGDDYMPETAERREESDDMLDLDISDLPDEDTGEEEEFLIKNPTPVTDEPPRPESPDDEELQPVIELTEEMLDEPEGRDDQAVEDMADDPDTPGLTTTEINSISAATATAGDIGEDEKIPEIEVEVVIPPQPETAAIEAVEEPVAEPATKPGSGGLNTIPLLFGILGIAAGGFGAWMAFDATGKVADLERRIQILSATSNHSQDHDITDIQQRLAKIERRLTGTPTLEAAAPLGAPPTIESTPLEPADEAISQPLPVTPQTSISSAPSNGDWVVNISSHAKEELALREIARLQSLGLNPEINRARVKERTWYRIQITGFASKDEAKAKLKNLQQYSGIKDAWIDKR
jgi:cell division septation protein DedD